MEIVRPRRTPTGAAVARSMVDAGVGRDDTANAVFRSTRGAAVHTPLAAV